MPSRKGLILVVSALLIISALNLISPGSDAQSKIPSHGLNSVTDSTANSLSNVSNVTFMFTGLPSNTTVNLDLGQSTYVSNSSSITVPVLAGNYTYSISNSKGYFSPEWAGRIHADPNGTAVEVAFSGVIGGSTGIYLQNGTEFSAFENSYSDLNPQPLDAVFDGTNNDTYVITDSPIGFYEISSAGTVTFFNTTEMPQDIALNTLTGDLIIAENNSIDVYSTSGILLGSVNLANTPNAIIYDNFTNTIWAGTDSSLLMYNATSLKLLNQVYGVNVQIPGQLVLNTINGTVYLMNVSANLTDNFLVEYNYGMQTVLEVNLPGFAGVAAFSSLYNKLYLTTISTGSDLFYLNQTNLISVSGYTNAASVQYVAGINAMVVISFGGSAYLINPVKQSLMYLMNPYTLPTLVIPGFGNSISFISRNTGTFLSTTFFEKVRSIKLIEEGLPALHNWYATVDNYTQGSTGNEIQFYEPAGDYTVNVKPVKGYISNTTFNINLSNPVLLRVVFHKLYSVTVNYLSIPANSYANLTIGTYHFNSTGDVPVKIFLINGSYNFSVSTSSGAYLSPSAGILVINGKNVSLNVIWALHVYSVRIKETGLPNGYVWSVYVDNLEHISNTSIMSLNLSSGEYFVSPEPVPGYFASNFSPSFNLSNQNLTVNIVYSPVLYNISMNLSNYTGNYPISITINGIIHSEYESNFYFLLPNGTYNYSIAFPGDIWRNISGKFKVNSSSISIPLAAAISYYYVSFMEAGLPPGTSWEITVNGEKIISNTTTLMSHLSNGTYTVEVGSVSGFQSISPFTFAVNGKNQTIDLKFQKSLTIYSLNVILLGIPFGHNVNLTVDNVTQTSIGGLPVTFSLPNGTYNMTIQLLTRSSIKLFGEYHVLFEVNGTNETLFVLIFNNHYLISFVVLNYNPLFNFCQGFNNVLSAPLFEPQKPFNNFRNQNSQKTDHLNGFSFKNPIGWF